MSTPKLYSVAPTRSSGNVGLAIERRVLVFTSEWHFKPAGVELLHAQLLSLLAPDVPFLFNWEEASASFIVECTSGNTDTITSKFLDVHRGIINMECARDNFESDSDDDEVESNPGSDVSRGWGDKRAISSDKIILSSELKRKKLLEAPRGESTPSRQSQPDPSASPSVSSHQFPQTYHIFFSEGVVDFQIVLRNILDIRKRYFETTLLDNHQTTPYDYVYIYNGSPLDNNALAQAITARCTLPDYKRNLYFAVKESKCKSVTKEEDTTLLHRDWAGFVYRKQGSEDPLLRTKSSKPVKPFHVPQTPEPTLRSPQAPQASVDKPASVIDKWARDLPPAVVNPQHIPPLKSFALPEKKPVWDGYLPYGEDVKPVVLKVESKVLPNRRVISASAATSLPSQKTVTSPQQQSPILPHLRQASLHQQQPQVQVASQTRLTPPHLRRPNPPSQSSQTRLTPPHLRRQNPPSQSSRPSCPSQPQQNRSNNLLDDSSIIGIPSLMDSIPVIVSSTRSVQPSDDLMTFDEPAIVVQQQSSSVMQELFSVFGSVREMQQQDDEVSTRQFRSTMNQKAPKPGRGRQDNSSSFADRLPLPSPPRQKPKASSSKQLFPELSSAEHDFADILELVKASTFQGEIRFQADLGRILMRSIPKQFVAKKYSDKSYKRDFLSESVIQHSAQSTFTKVLTSVPQDIHFLVDLKDESGNRMWEPKPFAWSVVYEFRCFSSTTAETFTIEMDDETMECSVSTDANLGNIYVHGIKRHWDIRLLVNGCIDVSEHHSEFVNAIKNSMFIPADAKSPDLRFELVPDLTQKYRLDAVRVHRTTKFRNTQNGSVLNVREMQDLMLQFKTIAVADSHITIFKASSKNPPNANPQEKLDMWYEVSITSPEIDRKLKELTWTSKDIQGLNGTDQILQPACLMLQKMDGVGFYNFNGVTDARPTRDPSPPPPEPEQFW